MRCKVRCSVNNIIPFQNYGVHQYSVVTTCIDAGVNYLDFADAADFVFGISQYDLAAKEAGVFVLSGASSFPVLTAAVVREMAKEMDIVSIKGGIAPSPYAGIGLNVMRAVIGYAGGPVQLFRDGRITQATGLGESMRFTVAPPAKLPLRKVHFSLVDVPDLRIIPPEYRALHDIWMGAGPIPEALHRILNLMAKTRATLNLPSWGPLSPIFHKILNLFKFGEHRGGMFVLAQGIKDGKNIERSWHLLAEGDDGFYIPSMAIEAILRKHLAGQVPESGARPATRELTLKDYDELFKNKSIYTGFRDSGDLTDPLYKRVLGSAFDTLPPRVKSFHNSVEARSWAGRARVQRGNNRFARFVAWLIGFPKETDDTNVSVTVTPDRN